MWLFIRAALDHRLTHGSWYLRQNGIHLRFDGGHRLAAARSLAAEGASVVLNGRTRERVDDAVARFEGAVSGANVRGVAADLATAEGAERVTAALPEADILVNNVGIFEPAPFEEIDDASWFSMA